MASRPTPRLPADIVQTIFDFIAGSEETTLIAQKRWVTLSLVQKEWARLALPYRTSFVLPTYSSVKRFARHASRLLSNGVKIRELYIQDVTNWEDLLLELLPLLTHTLTGVSLPMGLLKSPAVTELLKPETCRLARIHLEDDCYEDDDYSCSYTGEWREAVKTVLDLPTLKHLELIDMAIRGSATRPATSASGHIKTLHLRNIKFLDDIAIQHLTKSFGDQLQHLELTNVGFLDDPEDLYRSFGNELLSLKIDWHTPNYLLGACFMEMSLRLPKLESIDIDAVDTFQCRSESIYECFIKLPNSLRHYGIGPLNWGLACKLLKSKQDPAFLPNLQPSSTLWLSMKERVKHLDEVNDYNLRRAMAGGNGSAYIFALRWDDEREED